MEILLRAKCCSIDFSTPYFSIACKTARTFLRYILLIFLGKKRPTQQTLDNICEALNTNESILYIMSTSIEDIPEDNREAYKNLFPKIKDLFEAMFIVK